MIQVLANIIVNQMEEERIIQPEMKEHYRYALIVIMEKWIIIISVMCLGIVFRKTILVMLFLFFFLTLRKRTGGYHANSFAQCYIGTLLICIGVIHICPILVNHMSLVYMMLGCSVVAITLIGTVNHPDLALEYIELEEEKQSARFVLGLEGIILISIITLDMSKLCICYIAVAIILCAILLCLAKILRQEVYIYEKE